MRGMKKASMGALLLVLILALVACGGNNGANGNSGGGNAEANSGNAGNSAANAEGDAAGNTDTDGEEPAANPAEKVTIEYWHTYSDAEEAVLKDEIKPMFEEKYPNIELKLTRMPYEGLKQQVIAGVGGGAVPDLMRMDIIWVPEFASQGALLKVSDLDGFEEIRSTLFEGPMATNSFDGGFYGLPVNTNTKIAIYNKAALAEVGYTEAPATMDDYVKLAQALKAKGKYGIGVSGASAWSALPYFWSLGGKLTNDDYTQVEGFLNSPESVKALQTIVDWQKAELIVPPILGGEPGTWDGFKAGTYAMIDDGPWFFSILLGDANNEFDTLGNTIRAQMPAGDGGSKSVVGGEDLVIFAGAKHPEEAWTFARFMMTEEPQKAMAKVGLIPTNKAAASAMESMNIPYAAEYIKQPETALPRTPIPQYGEMETILNLALEKAIRGNETPQKALDDAAKQIQALLG